MLRIAFFSKKSFKETLKNIFAIACVRVFGGNFCDFVNRAAYRDLSCIRYGSATSPMRERSEFAVRCCVETLLG